MILCNRGIIFIYLLFFIETEVKEKVKEEKIRIRFNKAKI